MKNFLNLSLLRRIDCFATLAMTLSLLLFQTTGCGYTQKSLLPEHIKSIYVAPVKNGINLSAEISDKERFPIYRPGVEVEVTNAIINRFIFDGNLRVESEDRADAVVEAVLTDYRRDALRYTEGDDVEEYRVNIVLDAKVTDVRDKKPIWQDSHLTGDSTFFLSGSRKASEDEAAAKAVEDVARRVVEKTIEVW